jgi:diacylglycerol kinase (ATP)
MINIIIKLYRAFKYSINGLKCAWSSQLAFKIEVILFIAAIPCAIYLSRSTIELILMLSSLLLLLVMELFNSAIETVVNRIGMEYHELSGLAKDMASAAILVTGFNAIMTWGIILIKYII